MALCVQHQVNHFVSGRVRNCVVLFYRCRGKAVAGVATVVLAVGVSVSLLLLVIINMVRDSEAPVHAGDFIKVLIR